MDLSDFLSVASNAYGNYTNQQVSEAQASALQSTAQAQAAQANSKNADVKKWAIIGGSIFLGLLLLVFVFKKLR